MSKLIKFKNGIYQNPTHFNITDVSGNTKEITPNFGNVIQAGTPYSAENFNIITRQISYTIEDTSTSPNSFIADLEGLETQDLTDNLKMILVPNTTNTGSSTINIQNTGEVPLKKLGNLDLESGDIVRKQQTILNYNEEYNCFEVLNPQSISKKLEDISQFEKITYSDLKTKKDNNQLVEGKRYLLTDYRTKYQQPTSNNIKTMQVEQLVLTASSVNTFEPIVYSPEYPSDIIYYNLDDNKCEDGSTDRNGFITYRIDTINNLYCPQDWRTMLWYRSDGEHKTFGSGCNNIYIGLVDKLHNNVFGNYCDSNSFGNNCYSNTFGDSFSSNSFGNTCVSNTFGNSCNNNSFGNSCDSNIFGNDYDNNSLGNRCNYNIFGNNCNYNSFGNHCYSNTLGERCNYNSFGNSCYSNKFEGNCNYNSFGNGCDSNKFGDSCDSNKFGDSCDSNKFGDNCHYNSLGNGCDSNIFGNDCSINNLKNNCKFDSFDRRCTSNNLGCGCNQNSFGDNFRNLFVKSLFNKDVSNILDLRSKNITINIEQILGTGYIYWYFDSSNNIVTHVIP